MNEMEIVDAIMHFIILLVRIKFLFRRVLGEL